MENRFQRRVRRDAEFAEKNPSEKSFTSAFSASLRTLRRKSLFLEAPPPCAMHGKAAVVFLLILAVLGTAGGYWLGSRNMAPQAAAPAASTAPAAPKLLYYRNPMGLPDTSPVPKKDSMGMDYIAVYEGEAETAADEGQVKISPDRIQKLGVRSEPVERREIDRVLRAVGKIEIDERRMHTVAPKFEGWIDRLQVNSTGQPVGRGQPLFDAYSPELVSAQREYAIAVQGLASMKDADSDAQAAMRALADASLSRLKNWDVSAEQIQQLRSGKDSRRTLTFRSPIAGVVIEKKAVQGMRFMPGEALYQIADLSAVWIVAEVFEQDLAQISVGQSASVKINAYPDRQFMAKVDYIYPTLSAQTRTVPVRLALANPAGLLKPAMYANVEFAAGGTTGKVLTVPASAVIHSGTRQIVLIELGEGRFAPRAVRLGRQGEQYVELLEGVQEGESVVVSANFLIDAESNLKAALGGFGGVGEPVKAPAETPAAVSAEQHKGH
jgi:Cu(I)/Ag(I) efflux system membrane fusion protein